MNQAATIASLIALVACLFLATRNAGLRHLGARRLAILAGIWAAIIAGLVLVIRLTGLHVAP